MATSPITTCTVPLIYRTVRHSSPDNERFQQAVYQLIHGSSYRWWPAGIKEAVKPIWQSKKSKAYMCSRNSAIQNILDLQCRRQDISSFDWSIFLRSYSMSSHVVYHLRAMDSRELADFQDAYADISLIVQYSHSITIAGAHRWTLSNPNSSNTVALFISHDMMKPIHNHTRKPCLRLLRSAKSVIRSMISSQCGKRGKELYNTHESTGDNGNAGNRAKIQPDNQVSRPNQPLWYHHYPTSTISRKWNGENRPPSL